MKHSGMKAAYVSITAVTTRTKSRFVEICKDTVFVPPVPANLLELRDRITAAVALIDRDMLKRSELLNWIIG